jgi:hypothetical protein
VSWHKCILCKKRKGRKVELGENEKEDNVTQTKCRKRNQYKPKQKNYFRISIVFQISLYFSSSLKLQSSEWQNTGRLGSGIVPTHSHGLVSHHGTW